MNRTRSLQYLIVIQVLRVVAGVGLLKETVGPAGEACYALTPASALLQTGVWQLTITKQHCLMFVDRGQPGPPQWPVQAPTSRPVDDRDPNDRDPRRATAEA
eukprot:1384382-Pyramimonas_sp.AAC.1